MHQEHAPENILGVATFESTMEHVGWHLWLRNNGSTLFSQLIDTVLVILITHYVGGLPINESTSIPYQLGIYILSGYTFKVAVALFDTLPFYLSVHYLTRYLGLQQHDSSHRCPRAQRA